MNIAISKIGAPEKLSHENKGVSLISRIKFERTVKAQITAATRYNNEKPMFKTRSAIYRIVASKPLPEADEFIIVIT
ncbi:hypothetical protein [Pedobacter terrae]|uniref:hypothetical protein n=1 Tax=Pedobacter terrae TaxID=405671 RepID=UPI002FF4999D